MDNICRNLFKAIHEEKWLSVEYKNEQGEITKYWIGIININPQSRFMRVEGLHLAKYVTRKLTVNISSILSASVIDGSYFRTDPKLLRDIRENPAKYHVLFGNIANLDILNYLSDCNRLDTTPYQTDYALIGHLDGDWSRDYDLSPEQFQEIVKNFQYGAKQGKAGRKIKQLALNMMSVPTKEGLYVLAYQALRLDVKQRRLVKADSVTICTEFTINGVKQSVRKFLDAEDYELLSDFEANAELIKDRITETNPQISGVDDMPYLIAIGRDILLDLDEEYDAIYKMYENGEVTYPIQAFFGDMLKRADRRKNYPITLLNRNINLDQLLAIHNAMKYPLAYVQGPPGTGKTNTIVNAIVTAFFNERTVLFASYNNHPIDGVCSKLRTISYRGDRVVPFPMIRLGNDEKVLEALEEMGRLYEQVKDITIYDSTLERNKGDKVKRTKQLSELLARHEERLELLERKDAIEKLMQENRHLTFQTQLQGVQLAQVEGRLAQIGEVTDEEALKLVIEDEEEFRKYLYYTSAKYIKRLDEPKNTDLLEIIYSENEEEKVKAFNTYLKKEENLKKFQRIFPIIATTSISAHKVGEPGPCFDMVIMDEASQGNVAVSLVPILRGQNLMLVGDPQQLSPVILLNGIDNATLRKRYRVTDAYDYTKTSVYKTYLACDPISEEILLSHHYRCHRKIIGFNNRKYYQNKLLIESESREAEPLIFKDIKENVSNYKNVAPREAEEIVRFVRENPGKSIGVITPFANQREYVNAMLKRNEIGDVTCGTVHAFQGDEKDVVLFSLGLTDKTAYPTYEWLKNNKELINVATSRAREQLVILSSKKELERLHQQGQDDLYELVQYVRTNGTSEVSSRENASRALGIKPYSTETESAFLLTLHHALDNVLNTDKKCTVQKEVSIAHVFQDNSARNDLFYTGRFDFVVYERDYYKNEVPILAIELDGKEHKTDPYVQERDRKKNAICKEHGFELIRVDNTFARRYNYIKEILIKYFQSMNGR